jgi:hypothetical protein
MNFVHSLTLYAGTRTHAIEVIWSSFTHHNQDSSENHFRNDFRATFTCGRGVSICCAGGDCVFQPLVPLFETRFGYVCMSESDLEFLTYDVSNHERRLEEGDAFVTYV